MSRPTGYPGWASGVSGYVVEPTALQKAIGWQAGQAPPASYMNWLQGLGYQWIKFLDEQFTVVESGTVSLYSLTANGATGATIIASPAGTVRVQATGLGATGLPCPDYVPGTIGQAQVPYAMGYFQLGTTSPVFTWGFGVTSFFRTSTGTYQVVLARPLSSTQRQVTQLTIDGIGGSPNTVGVPAWLSTNQCEVLLRSSGALVDQAGFHFHVYSD